MVACVAFWRGLLRRPPIEHSVFLSGGKGGGAVSKSRGGHVKVREDKDAARKVSAVLTSLVRLVRAADVRTQRAIATAARKGARLPCRWPPRAASGYR